MNETVMFALLIELWRDLKDPAFLWQVLALAVSLLVAWGLSRYGQRQQFARASADYGALRAFGTGSLKRVAFPLLALLLVVIARKLFTFWRCRCCSRWRWCARWFMFCATLFHQAVGWQPRSG